MQYTDIFISICYNKFCAKNQHFFYFRITSLFLLFSWIIVLGRSCLHIYLIVKVVSKFFFHMPQFYFDSFHIALVSTLEGLAFSFSWGYSDFWQFGDYFNFKKTMVLRIETRQLDCFGFIFNTVLLLAEWEAKDWGYRKPISIEGSNTQTYPN